MFVDYYVRSYEEDLKRVVINNYKDTDNRPMEVTYAQK